MTTESLEEFRLYKQNNKCPIIGTHSEQFHQDEVFSTFFLKFIDGFRTSAVVRTRNKQILDECDVVVDVGGEYNAEKMRFDHHMREFKEVFDEENRIKMSSAGLIFKHFGSQAITSILNSPSFSKSFKTSDNKTSGENSIVNNSFQPNSLVSQMTEILQKVYERFIIVIDALDNGISKSISGESFTCLDKTTSGIRIGRLNGEIFEGRIGPEEQSRRFKLAWDIIEEEFYYCLRTLIFGYFPSLKILEDTYQKSKEKYPQFKGQVLVFDEPCSWKGVLYPFEKKRKVEGSVLFVVFKGENSYRISTVPVSPNSFEFRKGLPKEWRGLKEEDLCKTTGKNDMIFVHSSGFIGGCKTLETAIWVVEEAMKK